MNKLRSVQIEKTKHKNGKYLGYFEDKEEALEWIQRQINRYTFTPNPEKMSAARICREAKEKGIALHHRTFLRWLRNEGVEIRDRRPGRTSTHSNKNFTITDVVLDELNDYKEKNLMSYLADLGLRLVLGIPTEDVVIMLPDDEQGMVTLIFRKRKTGRVNMFTSGKIDKKFEQQIRMLMQRVNHVGMKAVVEYAQTNGYTYYGGTAI